MVKHKANISVDEWLEESVGTSQSNAIQANTNQESNLLPPPSIVVESPTEVTSRTPTVATADVPTFEDPTSEWFWLLLQQTGYELL